ncbi:MAG TPA: family 16 glycoside hydrolase [Steroidobacteraceae bacterium]|jgi:hypothetical protein|nr:family 16 glycoside hydrolase [Steroidobacteraceae bacterium]
MYTRCRNSVLLALLVLQSGIAIALDSGFIPPIGFYVNEPFGRVDRPFDPSPWEALGGNWQATSGTYDSTVASATAVTTLFEYFTNPIAAPPDPTPRPDFTYRARVLNRGSAATQLAGVILNYRDISNYDEAVFSPTGTMLLRRVSSGATTTLLTTSFAGGSQNVWFDLDLVVDHGALTIKVNGITRINALMQTGTTGGRVGFVTHNTTAKFDDMLVGSPFGEQPFKDNFSSGLNPRWTTSSAAWNVAGGTLNNTATELTSRADPGAGLFFQQETTAHYTLWTRMFNPYGGSGNLVGFFFNDGGVANPDAHGEVVFSPKGQARIDLFYDGAAHTIATAPYRGAPKTWFDVRLDNGPGAGELNVWVDGDLVFGNIDPSPVPDGSVGLLTHWAPGKFDDVRWDNNLHPTLVESFARPIGAPLWITNGTWDTGGSTLNSTAVGKDDLAIYQCRCWNTNAVIRARLLNQFGASGNLVGLVYNYVDAGPSDPADYNEVVFSTTGLAHLNTVINGVRTQVASSTHSVPRNTWFDVEVLRKGTTTTVKVNGTTIFDHVPQSKLGTGKIGVVTHWSKGQFDNVIVRDDPAR